MVLWSGKLCLKLKMLVKVKKSSTKGLGHRLFKTLQMTLNHKTTEIQNTRDTDISSGKQRTIGIVIFNGFLKFNVF